MKRLPIYIILLALMVLSCSEKKTAATSQPIDTIPMMVMQIQKCSRLYATEMRLHKIITHDDSKRLSGTFLNKDFSIDLPLGKRKVAIPIDATVKAYIDFADFSERNVKKHGDKVEIILPDPRLTLTSTKINHEEVKQYVALTRGNFTDEELTSYERQGREAVIRDLPQLQIFEMARNSAARTLIPIIMQMGYKEQDITITFRKKFTLDDIPAIIDKTTVEHANQ
jgi:hypothetical protein